MKESKGSIEAKVGCHHELEALLKP